MERNGEISGRHKLTRRIALWGISVNILLLALKLTAGFTSRSQAMIADGFNSASDVFASFMTYLGNKISSLPEDNEHPYGHGKAEYIFSMIISFSLVLVAYTIFKGAVESLLNGEKPIFSWWLVTVALFTFFSKFCLYVYARKVGSIHDSLLVLANAEDHRNDVLVAIGTLIGVGFGLISIYWVDAIVGMLISLWIAFMGFKIFSSAYSVLMDTNVDKDFKLRIWKTVEDVDGVDHIDSIVAKPIGVGFIIIVKVSVNGELTVNDGHRVAAIIKEKVKMHHSAADVLVHVNPA